MSITHSEVDPSSVSGNILDALTFEQYRELSDSTNNYRYTGIVSPNEYRDALEDPLTLSVETELGVVPAIVPLQYIDGFDVERTAALVGGKVPMFLTINAALVGTDKIEETIMRNEAAIVVESDHAETGDIQESLAEASGRTLRISDFIDSRIEESGHNAAWLAMYFARTELLKPQENPSGDLMEAFGDRPVFPRDGLSVIPGSLLLENQQARDNLWDLFNDRFEWLGGHHPVSMEDTREFFEEVITHPATYTSAKFEDGEITCAGIFMHDVNACSWVKPEVFDEIASGEDGDIPMYFFGIASKNNGQKLGRMAEVIDFHCHLAAEAGIEYDLFFESSNMSSQYIPESVLAYINASGVVQINGGVNRVKQTDYWFISCE